MGHYIKIQPANTAELRQAIFEVRRSVFVQEQNVTAAEEYDSYEVSSDHLAATVDGRVVGTCRYRNTDKGVKLERFAVLKEYRSTNVGRELLAHCLSLLQHQSYIYLHAQVQVVGFYARYGFVQEGPKFAEAGIDHYKMVYKKVIV